MSIEACPLCESPGGQEVWRNTHCRVIAVGDPTVPGYLRVILSQHAAEMTDVPAQEQAQLMRVVFATESIVRRRLKPDKVNLASLGNVVPHVHWHVIPRWRDDRWFPDPIWAAPRNTRPVPAERERLAREMIEGFARALRELLGERDPA